MTDIALQTQINLIRNSVVRDLAQSAYNLHKKWGQLHFSYLYVFILFFT